MSKLLEGKTAVIAGVANKWSLAFAIAESFAREGASIILTYLNEKQKETVEAMAGSLPIAKMLPCDVTRDEELSALTESLRELGKPVDVLVPQPGLCRTWTKRRSAANLPEMPSWRRATTPLFAVGVVSCSG